MCLKDVERVEVYCDLTDVDAFVLDTQNIENLYDICEEVHDLVSVEMCEMGLSIDSVIEFEIEESEDLTDHAVTAAIMDSIRASQCLDVSCDSDPAYLNVTLEGKVGEVLQEHVEAIAAVMCKRIGIVVPVHATRIIYTRTEPDTVQIDRSGIVSAKRKLRGSTES